MSLMLESYFILNNLVLASLALNTEIKEKSTAAIFDI